MSLAGQFRASRTTGPAIPLYVSPSVRGALEQLGVLLDDYHYSPHCRGRILAFTAANGTPSGCPELDREDEADASMVFEESLEPIPFDDEAWDKYEDMVMDARLLASNEHPFPIPAQGDDDRAFDAAMEADDAAMPLPAIPDDRDPRDWAEYRRMFDDREPPRYGYED
jgi:hypothetical protein